MIESARRKFVAVTMTILFIVFAVVTVTVIAILSGINRERIYSSLQNAVEAADQPLAPTKENEFDNVRSFTAFVDSQGNIVNLSFDSDVYNIDQVNQVIGQVYESERERGKINTIYFLKEATPDGQIIAATDRYLESDLFNKTYMLVIVCELTALTLLYLIVFKLSFWVVKPVVESFENQKQFVADASHELKTPITVIEASIQALKTEQGETKWSENILSQTQRINQLVTDMLDLAKSETANCVLSKIDLSTVVTKAAMILDCVAFENGKQYSYEIEKGIEMVADEKDIKRLVTILADNAIKYSEPNGVVKVLLQRKDKTTLTVFNSGCGFEEKDKDKLFLRFYRCDKSRTRENGGSGLGLAIAKSICDKYKYKISVDCKKDEYTTFSVVFDK